MSESDRFSPAPRPTSRQTSASGRGSAQDGLLLSATELFVGRGSHSPSEVKIFQELAAHLLPATRIGDRRRIASLLAGHKDAPAAILDSLARDDDPLTALPPLRYTAGLSVDLLKARCEQGPASLVRAIAAREDLADSVLSALCRHADADTLRGLLSRDDITLSASQRAALAARTEIAAALADHPAAQDLFPPEALMDEFFQLTGPMRAKAIAAAELTGLVRQVQASTDRRPGTPVFKSSILSGLYAAAVGSDLRRFQEDLGRSLGLPAEICTHMCERDGGQGLAIALKALGFDEARATGILVHVLGERLSLTAIRDLVRIHGVVSTNGARALIGRWMTGTPPVAAKPAAHAPQYQDGRDLAARLRGSLPGDRDTARGDIAVPAEPKKTTG